jgi:hypothetical protein
MHISEPLVNPQPRLVGVNDRRASELLFNLQLGLDQPRSTLPTMLAIVPAETRQPNKSCIASLVRW